MKTIDKKLSARPPVFHRTLPGIARKPQADVERQQIGQILRNNTVQARLTIGQPNDKYEQEADRVADEVMSMPEPKVQRQAEPEEEEEVPVQTKPIAEGISPLIQRQAEPEEEEEVEPENEEEEAPLQKKYSINRTTPISSGLQNQIQSLKGGGQPLPESERAFFESRFGTDFSDVRVHNNLQASRVARAINARAFVLGKDVVFGGGEYAPHTNAGRKLLAHEFTHVVQQATKPRAQTIQRWWYEEPPQVVIERQLLAMEKLRRLESAIDRQARQQNVPARILRGVIHYETLDRGVFETYTEFYGVSRRRWNVTLGPGDVSVRRVADLLHPGRDWGRRPLSSQEFREIVRQLRIPEDHARILAQSMWSYFDLFSRVPGKTVDDRWRFAIASHKWGDGNVRAAQVRASNESRNANSWSDVANHVDDDVVEFVNNVTAYTSTRLSRNPYL